MQGIKTTRYGHSRIRASCQAGSAVVDRDDALGYPDQHRQAAEKLATKLGWSGTWHHAVVPGINGFVWSRAHPDITETTFTVEQPHPPAGGRTMRRGAALYHLAALGIAFSAALP